MSTMPFLKPRIRSVFSFTITLCLAVAIIVFYQAKEATSHGDKQITTATKELTDKTNKASGTVASRFHEGIFKRKPADIKHQSIQHIMTVKNFTCNNPQPRLVGVEEFHTKKPHLVYTPYATVLHHCRFDTGSCFGDQSTCQAIEQKEVNLVFHVYNTISKSVDWIVLKAYNDTLCGCSNKVTRYQVRSTKSLESENVVTPTKAQIINTKEIKDNDKGSAQNKAKPSTRSIVLMLMNLLFFAL